jgi:ABC-2 type transport system ATP-binding protein
VNKNKSPIISVSGVYKRFGKKQILADISFSVNRGEIFGILGKNGAGKTILINTLLGLIKPDKGEIKVFGMNLETHLTPIRQRVNLAAAYQNLQTQATIKDNLSLFAGLYGVNRPQQKIDWLLSEFGLSDLAGKNQKLYYLSSGENTKVMLCKALINDPDILYLDEPTAFLDPQSRNQVMELIKLLIKQKQVTFIYTSHNLEEITKLCARVLVLKQGKISYIGKIPSRTELMRYY